MKFRRHLVLLTALVLIALSCDRVSAQAYGEFQDFTLVLESPKTKYLELQPIPLLITLKNDTRTPLVGHIALEFGASFLHLYVDHGDGPQEVPVSTMILDIVASPRVFPPGEQIKKSTGLNFGLDTAFPKPGIYRLHLRFRSLDGRETLSSKPMEVEIVQPDGPDAQALQFIRDHSNPAYFFTGIQAVKNPEQLQVLETFVREYGDSSYGNDASFALGEVQFAMRDYEKARATLEKLLKKPNYAFAADVLDLLKTIEQRTRVADRP